MKIALIAPSPVPFVIGGAENLWAGLLQAFNRQPGIECELIKLPSPERNLAEVFHSYRRFAQLDVSHFDLVISTKYPAWAVQHPNHIVYLQHKLRGLYDTYPSGLPIALNAEQLAHSALPTHIIQAIQSASKVESKVESRDKSTYSNTEGLHIADVATAMLAALEQSSDKELWRFPGPLARACVHLLDRIALAPGRIQRYAAISRTVAARADYFPHGVTVDVMHHPTSLPLKDTSAQSATTQSSLPSSTPQAIFSASRLDPSKRLDLIIDAYLQTELTLPLRLAGSGPALQALQQRAAGDKRIHFLGRLTDAELAEEYAQALFVPFVPLQEDYGLITVEAMASGRAVLGTTDAGGVTELVEHKKTGLIVEPTAVALAQGMRELAADPQATLAMGAAAHERVASISWQGLVEFLLRAPVNKVITKFTTLATTLVTTKARPRFTVINTFPLTPAVSGGQVRLLGIYRQLARHADIHFINLGGARSPHHVRTLAPGLTEEIVPRTTEFMRAEQDLEKILQASVGDLAAALYPNLVPAWLHAIELARKDIDAVICSHPYGHPALAATGYQGKLFYEGHNIESDLKQSIYQGQPWPLAEIHRIEGDCIAAADGITVCSAEEAARIQELYAIKRQRIAIVPNGVDATQTPFQTLAARRANQRRNSAHKPIALFIGSAHQPNVEGAELLLQTARDCSEFDFIFMGSVCKRLDSGAVKLPRNVRLLGVVSAGEKSLWLALADAGLNPIISGAGTNLKLAEYAAAGLPIISTKFGARGGVLTEGVHYLAAEPQAIAEALRQLMAMPDTACEEMIKLADASVRRTLDWQAIAEDYAIFLTC